MRLPTWKGAVAWISEPENQAKLLIFGSWIVLGMTVLGYLIIAYLLFQ